MRRVIALLAGILAGCVPTVFRSDREVAEDIAAPAGLAERERSAGAFVLATRERFSAPGSEVTVYIEGDGMAWMSRHQPSTDPTPGDPVALRLAALDPAPNVAWVARPCQYVPMARNPECNVSYWTSGRYAEKAVASIDAAVSAIKLAARARTVHLVGYSGGGGIAALVSARRDDVATLRTVAGNLDHAAFTAHHGVSPMRGSLNPADSAGRVRSIPQVHYVGGQDKVVPELVARAYVRRMEAPECARVMTIPGATHTQGWDAFWRGAAADVPRCR